MEDDVRFQGYPPYCSNLMFIPVLRPREEVIRHDVVLVPKMPVFSIVRNMEGYIVSPLIDAHGDYYISVRYADRIVHVYSLKSDVWGNIYPCELYSKINYHEYYLDGFRNTNAADRYSEDKFFRRIPSCSYTYLIYRMDQRNNRLIYVECANWKSYVMKSRLSPHVATENESKWEGLAASFDETTFYTGKRDLVDYSPVQDYLDYAQDHIDS